MHLSKQFLFSLVLVFSSICPFAASAETSSMLVEAEHFQFAGSWTVSLSKDALEGKCLVIQDAKGKSEQALTAIDVPQTADYYVWARSMDLAKDSPGTRTYQVLVDHQPLDKSAGGHRQEGYQWEILGQVKLTQGGHLISIRDLEQSYARCDAILLTTSDADITTYSADQLNDIRIQPVGKTVASPFANYPAPFDGADRQDVIGNLENDHLRIQFVEYVSAQGQTLIHPAFQLKRDGQWVTLNDNPGDQKLFLINADDIKVKFPLGRPTWSGGSNKDASIEVDGQEYAVSADGPDPFSAADVTALHATSYRHLTENKAELIYQSEAGLKVTTTWTLNEYDVQVTCDIIPDRSGYYSLGYMAFDAHDREEISYVQLPPLSQFQRLPTSPQLIPSDMMPHALALVEIPADAKSSAKSSFAVLADPGGIPFDWPVNTTFNPPYGFSLINADNRVQPCIFSPVLGTKRSLWTQGEKQQVVFRLLAYPGDWTETLKVASDTVMGIEDYRSPIHGSLTDAVFNMFDLMKDDDASGWNSDLKGFYNIEIPSAVTNAAPLVVVSAALISGDEELYVSRALPTIASTLTRPTAHFGRPGEVGDWQNKPKNDPKIAPVKLTVPGKFYSTPYWEGLDNLLGELNPWMAKFVLPDGKPFHVTPYNVSCPYWSSLMSQYRYQPTAELLAEIEKQADTFIQEKIYARQDTLVSFEKFYNISFYPYWWDLIDLYEITGKEKYLRAAEVGGYHSIAGIWSNPSVPKGDATIHKDNKLVADTRVLFYKNEYYRLGADPKDMSITAGNRHWVDHYTVPEKQVPAWQIARTGLGMEQPSTYWPYLWLRENQGMRNILMSISAPHLLRLAHYSEDDLFKTYARNSVIGRFTNYPGYYYTGYTDVPGQPDFPYAGPDTSRIYYHHIPVHLGFTIDYLMTQAFARSGGKIAFPWVKQQDYAWFVSRVHGLEAGEVFGNDGAKLFLDRDIVNVDNIMIDWFTARSSDTIYVVAMSQSDEAMKLPIEFDAGEISLDADRPVKVYTNDQDKPQLIDATELADVTISPKGLTVVCLPVKPQGATPDITPLSGNGHLVYDMPEGFGGQFHLFRIRSPFGKDAVYAVLLGGGGTDEFVLEVKINGHTQTISTFPYETITYPLSMDTDIDVHVAIHSKSSAELYVINAKLEN